jgi:hypothetical protein
MKRLIIIALGLVTALGLAGCNEKDTVSAQVTQAVDRQQSQYNIAQPVPAFNWSLERDLVIQLYNLRNMRAATHSVWRSDLGTIEGDCPSIGFGIPYDTSLTNPLRGTRLSENGYSHNYQGGSITTIEQAEPNGIYASKNTAATWVMCAGDGGQIEPVYVETRVTVYPYPVEVDYETNRAVKAGSASVTITNGD